VVSNTYDHEAKNVSLHLPFPAYWYTDTGELLKANSDILTLDALAAETSQTLLISQEPLLDIQIIKPERGLYIANRLILPFFVPFAIGSLEIQAVVTEINRSQVDCVEFYIDDELQTIDTEAPYSWVWSQRSFGAHMIKVLAYKNNKNAIDEIKVWKIL
jgi:hypothetical protein